MRATFEHSRFSVEHAERGSPIEEGCCKSSALGADMTVDKSMKAAECHFTGPLKKNAPEDPKRSETQRFSG